MSFRAILFCLMLSAAPVAAFDAIPPGDVAADFSLPDVQGNKHRLHDYRGKFVLVSFWSVDCPHCRDDMTSLELMYRRLRASGFEVLAINAGDSLERVQSMLRLNPVSYTILLDLDLEMRRWGVPAIPTSYLIGPDGQRLYRAVGTRLWHSDDMIRRFELIMKRKVGGF